MMTSMTISFFSTLHYNEIDQYISVHFLPSFCCNFNFQLFDDNTFSFFSFDFFFNGLPFTLFTATIRCMYIYIKQWKTTIKSAQQVERYKIIIMMLKQRKNKEKILNNFVRKSIKIPMRRIFGTNNKIITIIIMMRSYLF